jgi:metallo-beta-lactamase class B
MRSSPSLLVALCLAGCGAAASMGGPARVRRCHEGDAVTLSEDLTLACVARGVWVFTALASETHAYPRYPANGLFLEREAVLVDAAWTDAQAEALRAFAASRGHPLAAAIVTHAHDDRVGGAAALERAGVPVFATEATIALARAAGGAVPDHVLAEGALAGVTWRFPGAGHSSDNIVVFHAASGTLFGGCLVKALDATTLGNVADADLASWADALGDVREAFASARIVVPGHGAPGDVRLLAHTESLLGVDTCGVDDDCIATIDPLTPCGCCGCAEPRAWGRVHAARLAETAQMSCQPICDEAARSVCPACAEQEARLRAVHATCDRGACVLTP